MNRFEQRLLAEGLRAIEGDSPALSDFVADESAVTFEAQLLQRAHALDSQLQISALFAHFKSLTKKLFLLLSFFLLLLGASSVEQLFFSKQGTQINFFWVFALFLIPNFITLFLWLLLFSRPCLLSHGWLARLSLFILKAMEKRFNPQSVQHPHFWTLFKCYFRVYFSPYLGRYQLSVLTHLLWLSYFLGASLMLLLMLATHQVDFIWQTSILSLSSFEWVTQLLASLPHALGIPVPNFEQIQQSHLGAIKAMSDAQQSRFVWSSLLLSSLLLYGLLPRCLLFLLMRLLLTAKRKKFNLNLTLPYYVQLRQQLTPNVSFLGVSDLDTESVESAAHQFSDVPCSPLPASFYPLAIELSPVQLIFCKKHIQQYSPEHLASLPHICDFQSQQAVLKGMSEIEVQAIVIYVSLSRLPDRGVLGFIKSLTQASNKLFYLLLIDDRAKPCAQLDRRRSEWYALAQQANIPLEQIIHTCSCDVAEQR